MNALDILGLTINLKKWNKEKQLPLFILNDFLIQKAIINPRLLIVKYLIIGMTITVIAN